MTTRKVVDVLRGQSIYPPPVWLMRQAGRFLPEYRETRQRAGSFLDLCYNPDLAVEVTLQPIRRFGFDASIVFSDILVVPHALGRDLRFEEGVGPQMTPITAEEIGRLDGARFHEKLEPVYETVRRLREALPGETTLIGFCGAPWTVATYMIAGRGTPDQAPAKLFAFRERHVFEGLLWVLAEKSAEYLIRQIEAGADVVQIFDSWAGVLDDETFDAFAVAPVRAVVKRVKEKYPAVPIVGFPRGAGSRYASYREATGVDAVGLDWTVPMESAKLLQSKGPVQGNLDPLRLVAGGRALDDGIDRILAELGGGPLVFNLGHGILPETPVAHVERMLMRIREAGR